MIQFARSPQGSVRSAAFLLAKHFKVAKMMDYGDEFRAYFTKLFKSPSVKPATVLELGNHLRDFIEKGEHHNTQLTQAAKDVISSIGGFEKFKVADYNRKAGTVTSDIAIEKLEMTNRNYHRKAVPYNPRSQTLK